MMNDEFVERGTWNVEHGMWNVVRGMWNVDRMACGVLRVRLKLFCVIALVVAVGCRTGESTEEPDVISRPTSEITLIEELRVGDSESEDEPLFEDISEIEVADDGTMYVLDIRSPAVSVLDGDGSFIRHIGAAGDGPGEFRYPSGLLVDGDSLAVLRAFGRLSVFDRNTGAYRTQHAFPTTTPYMVNALLARHDNRFLVQTNHGGGFDADADGADEARIMQVESGADSARVVLSLPATELLLEATEGGAPGALTIAPFARRPLCAEASGRVYCGWTNDLEFTVLSAAGDSTGRMEVDFEPLPISAADRAPHEARFAGTGFEPNLRFNDTWPAFEAVVGDDEGRLWIKVRATRDDNATTLWIVDPESGTAESASIKGNFTPLDAGGGKLYGRLTMESGLQALVRYAIS